MNYLGQNLWSNTCILMQMPWKIQIRFSCSFKDGQLILFEADSLCKCSGLIFLFIISNPALDLQHWTNRIGLPWKCAKL